MLQPKRVTWRRNHRWSYEGVATRCNKVSFGTWGLEATQGNYVTDHQIEAARIVLSRYTRKGGKFWIRIFPQLGRTKKPAQVRMGSGKGSIDGWAAVVKREPSCLKLVDFPTKMLKKHSVRLDSSSMLPASRSRRVRRLF